jgi:hypothetical protein
VGNYFAILGRVADQRNDDLCQRVVVQEVGQHVALCHRELLALTKGYSDRAKLQSISQHGDKEIQSSVPNPGYPYTTFPSMF